MKPKVLIDQIIPEEVESYIAEHCEITKIPRRLPREELFEKLADVEGFLTSGGSIDDELLDHAPKLKIVSNVSVGYNSFNIEAMKRRNVLGTHTPYVLDDTVADLVLALMLSAARRIAELDRFIRAGKWTKLVDESYFGIDVHHATVGILGMGRIGEAIARRCKYGFNMDVLYHSRTRKEDIEQRVEMEYASMEKVLKESDFVVLMTPLTEETRHLIGKEQFEMMKKSAIFINASRGATVDEDAMITALQNGVIRGAGLDVFTEEPTDPNNPLLQLENVVVVPHIGSATVTTRSAMAKVAAENLVSGVKGETPKYVVKELQELVK